MQNLINRPRLTHVCAFLLSAVLSAGVHAHGEFGEHVDEFQKHIDDYAADVEALATTLDGIEDTYAASGKASLDAFVQQWEKVPFHAAVETVATPLYPPIWAGISRLRQAIDQGAAAPEVRRRGDAVEAALHEGLGALRYAAYRRQQGDTPADTGHDQPAAGDDAEEIRQIMAALDNALHEYREGNVKQAQSLVQAAYLQRFEGLEGDLIEQDPELVAALEEDFNGALPNLMSAGAPAGEVSDLVEQMKTKLHRADELLAESGDDEAKVF